MSNLSPRLAQKTGESNHKPERCVLELCQLASEHVKAAGFEFRGSSRTTEACYYGWPGCTALLRIASHRSDPRNKGVPGKVVSKLTFTGNRLTGPGTMRTSDEKVKKMIAEAVAQYFLRR